MVVELVQLIMTHMEITSDPAVVGDIKSSAAGSGTALRLLRQAQEPNQGPWNIKKDPNCMVVWIFLCTFALEINNHT